jgi:hypothetical protein
VNGPLKWRESMAIANDLSGCIQFDSAVEDNCSVAWWICQCPYGDNGGILSLNRRADKDGKEQKALRCAV